MNRRTSERKKDEKRSEPDEKPGPAADQDQRPYYYDDAHGYENFDPDSEADEDDDEDPPIRPSLRGLPP